MSRIQKKQSHHTQIETTPRPPVSTKNAAPFYINEEQLLLVYQPQVDIQTGKVFGIEALSRWNHPELGQVPLTDFIATAERIGMIKPLSEWLLDTACRQALAW